VQKLPGGALAITPVTGNTVGKRTIIPSVSESNRPAPTQDDINATAAKYGITPEEVKKRLGIQ
jgi:mRNA-degrading endonuclease toxin of MazEF toxin-antitoxin module